MRFLAIVFCCLCSALNGAASPIQPVTEELPPDQFTLAEIDLSLRAADQLIAATEKTLNAQRQIRQQMMDYRQVKSEYLKNQQSRELIVRMVKSAYSLQNAIKANYLDDALDGAFLHELAFFSQIAAKKSLPKP